MSLTQSRSIIIHGVFIFCYLASATVNPSNTISLLIRVASGLIICFYLIGHSMQSLLKKYFAFTQRTIWGEFSFIFLLSFSYLMCLSTVLCLGHSLNSFNLGLAIIPVTIVFDLAGLLINFGLKTERNLANYRSLWLIVPVFLFGCSLAALVLSDYSWPSMPGWDVYTHLGNSNWIVAHHGTTNLMPTVPYTYLFHILVSSLSFFTGVDPHNIFWAAPFLTIPAYGILVYGISYLLTEDRIQSLSAALIALTIYGGGGFLGPQYFFPSTMSLILFLLLLILLLDFPDKPSGLLIPVYAFFLVYYAFYPFPIIITLPIFLFFITQKKDSPSQLSRRSVLLSNLSLFGMISLSALAGFIVPFGHTFSFTEKLEMLRAAYTDLFWFLVLLGSLYILFRFSTNNQNKEKRLLQILAYTVSLLIVYFLPPAGFRRVELFFRSFLAIVASFVFFWIRDTMKLARIKVVLSIHKHKISLEKLSVFASFIVLVLSISLLIHPYLSYANNISNWSNLSEDEYQAAEWIEKNSLPHSYILTDPSTGKVLRGLTIRNCSTSFLIKGQSISAHARGLPNLSKLIYDFFREEDLLKIPSYLEEFPIKPDLIVVTTRTSAWIRWGKLNSTYCAPTSDTLETFQGDSKFSTSFFKLLKTFQTVRIYGLGEAEVCSVWTDGSFVEGWSWWLGGAYGNYSSATDGDMLNITVQARSAEDAWVALRKEVPNCSDAICVKVRYRIDVPGYVLRIRLWDSAKRSLAIKNLKQPSEWTEETIPLTTEEARSVSLVGIQIWTKDAVFHTVRIDYVSFLTVISQ